MSCNESLLFWIIQHFWNFVTGAIVAFLGYFSPISSIEHVIIVAIIIDLLTGLWASRIKGIGWQSLKGWRTIYKMFFAIVIVMLAYAMDKEIGSDMFQIHRVIAFIITGFELWSILENAAKISNHKIFVILKTFMEDKIKKETGININEKKND